MKRVDIILPTAINIINLVHENIVDNLRRGQSSDLELPSLYRRAFLITNETVEIAVTRENVTDE